MQKASQNGNRDRERGTSQFHVASLGRSRLIGVRELAEWLNLTENAVRSMVQRRQIPHNKLASRIRFDPDVIQAWLNGQRVSPLEADAA